MASGDKIDSITVVVQVNTGTSGSPVWTTIGGQKDAKLTRKMKPEDSTTKEVTSRYKTSIAGFKEWGVSCGALKVESDAAYTALETAYNNDAQVQLRWTKVSTGVYTGSAWITSLAENSKEKGPVELSIEFEGTGPITAV